MSTFRSVARSLYHRIQDWPLVSDARERARGKGAATGFVDKKKFERRAMRWRQRGAKIGENTRILGVVDAVNPHLITIGDNCVIGAQAGILTHGPTKTAPVVLGDNVFVGFGAIILPGVTVGSDCIVGAGAVVTRDIPAGSICAGNPARVIRARDPRELESYITDMREGRRIGHADYEPPVSGKAP